MISQSWDINTLKEDSYLKKNGKDNPKANKNTDRSTSCIFGYYL